MTSDPSDLDLDLDVDAPGSSLGDPLLARVARAPAVPPRESIGQTLAGRYRLVALLGQGGMGRVYEAADLELGRRVAVKLLRAAPIKPEARERFVRERTVTALLEHPGIVPVYDAGVTGDGEPFYVMRVARGEPLDRLIARARGLDERLALVPNVIAVADAVAFANSHGIVHRDLKPANVLVGTFGETLVADWGLAKRVGETVPESSAPLTTSSETLTGTVLGTPAYMAPEQSAGRTVDERADVYALGATLLHVLTGAPPGAATPEPGTPADILAIARKALAADPAARYPRVADLAGELRRFQTGQIVAARRYSRAELLLRWARRHRLELAFAAILVTVVVAGAVRIVRARDAADSLNEELTLLQARAQLDHDPTAALAWIKRYPRSAPGWDDALTIAADARARGVARRVWDLGHPVGSVAFSPDGRTLAAGARDGTVALIDVDGGITRTWHAPDGVGDGILFSADGAWLATTDGATAVRLWEVATGGSRLLPGARGGIRFSPDGSLLETWHSDNRPRLWRVASGAPVLEPDGPRTTMMFVPGAGVAVAVGADLALVDPESGRRLASTRLPGPAIELAAPARGGWVAAISDGAVVIWNPTTGAMTRIAGPPSGIGLLEVSADGRRMMACAPWMNASDTDWLIDVRAATLSRLSGDERCSRRGFHFSPDGESFVSTGFGTELRLHDLGERRMTRLLGHDGAVSGAVFLLDGRWLASAGSDHTVRLWRIDDELRVVRAVLALDRFGANGALLVADPRTGDVALVDVATGGRRALSGPRPAEISGKGTLSPDGRVAAFPIPGAFVIVRDATQVRALPADPILLDDTAAALSSDGAFLAQTSPRSEVRIVDLATGRVRQLPPLDDAGFTIAWSPDDRLLAAGGRDGTARVYDVATGAERARLRCGDWVWNVAFSRDGGRLAADCAGGSVRILDLAGGTTQVLEGHIGMALGAEFTADGRALFSSGADGTVRRWDLETGRGRVVERWPAAVGLVALSPDGARLMTRSFMTVRITDATAIPAFAPKPADVLRWVDGLTTARVDALP